MDDAPATITPAVFEPAMTLPSPPALPPTRMPLLAMNTAAPMPAMGLFPEASVPMRLPRMLPVEPTSNSTPALPLPLTTLPCPAPAPPMVTFSTPGSTSMP